MSRAMRQGAASLSGKIFSTVLAFTLGVIVVTSLVLTCIFYVSSERDCESRLMEQAREAAAYLNETPSAKDASTLSAQFNGRVRFTLISADGQVIYDSATKDPSTLENHGTRPEVVAAEGSGEGALTRFSETLGLDTVYAAVRLGDGSVVRLSETRQSLLMFAGSLMAPVVFALVIAAVLVMLLSRVLTRRIMKPIDALDFSEPLQNDIYEEMTPLLERIDEQQRQLRTQNEELARAESMRRDFSANVSHEMKTPLQVIAGYAELMKDGLVPPEDTARFAGVIYDESQAMRSLINDVLVLSRLDEAGLGDGAARMVDVLAVSERVAGRLEALACERGVRVTVQGEHLSMVGSETLIEEMLYNLVENGIRYNHEGGEVFVSIAREDDAASANRGPKGEPSADEKALSLVIRVQDTGPGIPPEMREKIFERFFRMEKSRSKETGGTGLGLAIVKHAAICHGGCVEVLGEEGAGATFVLRFPLAA